MRLVLNMSLQKLGAGILILGIGLVMGHPDGAPASVAPTWLPPLARILIIGGLLVVLLGYIRETIIQAFKWVPESFQIVIEIVIISTIDLWLPLVDGVNRLRRLLVGTIVNLAE